MYMLKKIVQSLLGAGLLALAIWIIHGELHGVHYHDVTREIAAIPGWRLAAALLLTLVSYLLLTCYDVLALRYAQRMIPYRKVCLASFISYAFSNTIGLSLLTSGSIRYRMYSAWGLNIEEIGKVIAFAVVTFWLGICTVGGITFSFAPGIQGFIPPQIPLSAAALGCVFLLAISAYLLFTLFGGRSVRLGHYTIETPRPALALRQIILGTCDWLSVGSVFVVLLPENTGFSFGQLLAVYLAAQIIALISHVPGGIGIFESIVLLALKGTPTENLLGALLIFRSIYYILPLMTAGLLAGAFEAREHRFTFGKITRKMERWTVVLVPHLLSLLILVAGAVLLFSGATPAVTARLHWLENFLPLPVIELSHFLGSLVGACLLLLARGLQKRLDGAYLLSICLLGLGIALSLLKGGDYEEAFFLTALLFSLLPCRHFFHRKASLLKISFTWGWVGTIIIVLITSIGLTLFAGKHLEYSADLWWQFAFEGDVPRSLRASVGAMIVLMLFAVSRLLRTVPPVLNTPDAEILDKARRIIAAAPETISNLALLGDKELLINEAETAMIMYAVEGRSWVALGDPIGPVSEHEELIWRFRDLCEQHNGWPIFYEVGTRGLHQYLDIGLNLLKLGEEARVPLPDFSLEGKKRSGLRYTHRKLTKEGYQFSIEPPAGVPAFLDELRTISDSWLSEKKTREKGFSLGFFAPAYILANPVALVRKEGKIVAFANVWQGSDRDELSIDLMRYTPDASRGVMEYLFICLMLWGQENGYRWFNLGMAPLSGLENRNGAPLWNRFGALLFRHGENFYNFSGLREYKEKFDPIWEPRYLASPGGLALPLIFTNIAALISGGVKGVFRK